MIRGIGSLSSIALFALPLTVMPVRAVAVVGAAGLLLSAVAIAVPWRRAATAAAIAFIGQYGLALALGSPRLDLPRAGAFGVALVLSMQSVDLGCRARRARVHRGVVASHVRRSIALAAASGVALLLALVPAIALAPVVPASVPSFSAALGGLGAIAVVAWSVVRAQRRRAVDRRGDAGSTAS